MARVAMRAGDAICLTSGSPGREGLKIIDECAAFHRTRRWKSVSFLGAVVARLPCGRAKAGTDVLPAGTRQTELYGNLDRVERVECSDPAQQTRAGRS